MSAALWPVRGRRGPVRLQLLRRAAPERGRILPGVRGPTGRAARRPPAGVRHLQPVPTAHRPDGVPSRDGQRSGTDTGGRVGGYVRGRFAVGGAPFSRRRVYGTFCATRFATRRLTDEWPLGPYMR